MAKRKQPDTSAENKKPRLLGWKEQLATVVKNAVFEEDGNKTIWAVLSPDVDGALSYVFLREWATRLGVATRVVGEYNSKQLTIYDGLELKRVCATALFLDLDQHFAPHNIGQHFLGAIDVDPETYFNPNLYFRLAEHQYTSKYPYGTAHLLGWALFDEGDFPPLSVPGKARSLFVHADSTYQNCIKYRPNATQWADRLFQQNDRPRTLALLLTNEYHKGGVAPHAEMLRSIAPYVRGRVPESWEVCRGFQSCKGTKGLFGLMDRFSEWLRVEGRMPKKIPPSRVAWQGKLEKVDRKGDMKEFLANSSRPVQSHAIIYRQTISATFGELVEVPDIRLF